ncbi:MAG: hypothetical protein WC806_01040 [Candidatus Gracilibacteria bacterium]|jgi:hypothetical protein
MENFSSTLKNVGRSALAAGLLALVACETNVEPTKSCLNLSNDGVPSCNDIIDEGVISHCEALRREIEKRMMSLCMTKASGLKIRCNPKVRNDNEKPQYICNEVNPFVY